MSLYSVLIGARGGYNIGYRTQKTNEKLRQNSSRVAKNSMHLIGRAIDFKVRNRSIQNLEGVAKKLTPGGLGVYSGFIHIDTGLIVAGRPNLKVGKIKN